MDTSKRMPLDDVRPVYQVGAFQYEGVINDGSTARGCTGGRDSSELVTTESSRLAYGERPAHNAQMGDVTLIRAVLAVRGVGGDSAVLIGACPIGNHQGSHDCSADAGGYRWSFRGSVFNERAEEPGYVRLWIRSEGDITAERLEAKQN
jgi:hypothetical protein